MEAMEFANDPAEPLFVLSMTPVPETFVAQVVRAVFVDDTVPQGVPPSTIQNGFEFRFTPPVVGIAAIETFAPDSNSKVHLLPDDPDVQDGVVIAEVNVPQAWYVFPAVAVPALNVARDSALAQDVPFAAPAAVCAKNTSDAIAEEHSSRNVITYLI